MRDAWVRSVVASVGTIAVVTGLVAAVVGGAAVVIGFQQGIRILAVMGVAVIVTVPYFVVIGMRMRRAADQESDRTVDSGLQDHVDGGVVIDDEDHPFPPREGAFGGWRSIRSIRAGKAYVVAKRLVAMLPLLVMLGLLLYEARGMDQRVAVVFPPKGKMLDNAQAYLDAVSAGDVSGALALSDEEEYFGDVPNGRVFPPSRSLLTDEVLGNAVERISDVRIVDSHVSELNDERGGLGPDTTGAVDVRFMLGGVVRKATLGYRYVDGSWILVNGLLDSLEFAADHWAYVPFDIGSVSTAAADGCGGADRCPTTYLLFPGIYHITLHGDGGPRTFRVCPPCDPAKPLGEPPEFDVTVLPPQNVSVSIDAEAPR